MIKGSGFHLRLLAVAAIMTLLPAVYFGLILLDVAFMIWFAGSAVPSMLEHLGGIGVFFFIGGAFLVAMAFLGVLLLPLIRGWGEKPKPFVLDRQRGARLVELVVAVAGQVRSPTPAEVHLTCDVNASAHLVSLWGRSLVLTIGLPLLEGLDARQLAGVIAHELAHFRQSFAMRLYALVWRSQRWMADLLDEDSPWELMVSAAPTVVTRAIGLLLTRIVHPLLCGLCYVSHVVSFGMLRQMEFDADRYSARLIGSVSAADAMGMIRVLNEAQRRSHTTWKEAWLTRHELYDDLPGLMGSALKELSPEERRGIVARAGNEEAGRFDAHPAHAARVASMLAEKAEGVLEISGPACGLVERFDQLCREVTIWQYKTGKFRYSEGDLISAERIERQRRRRAEELAPLQSFFQGVVSHLCPIRPLEGWAAEPRDPMAAQTLKRLREAVVHTSDDARRTMGELLAADAILLESDRASVMLSAGLDVPDGMFSVPMSDDGQCDAVRMEAKERAASAIEAMNPFHEAIESRLRIVVALAQDSDGRAEVARLLEWLDGYRQWGQYAATIRRVHARLAALAAVDRKAPGAILLPHTLNALCERASENLPAMRKHLAGLEYPLGDMPSGTLLADYRV